MGKCKSWTLDSGLDYGLIFGLPGFWTKFSFGDDHFLPCSVWQNRPRAFDFTSSSAIGTISGSHWMILYNAG